MPLYDSMGQHYSKFRVPDSRIVDALISLLNLPKSSVIADIGAGIGGYSRAICASQQRFAIANQGFFVHAVEPSDIMQSQAIAHPQVRWFKGYAENLPLPNSSVDAAISILAIHHFSNLAKAIQEMHRVVKTGAIVFFTFDIRKGERIWLTDYFPFLWEDALRFLPLENLVELIKENTGRAVEAFTFLLPHDLSDLFAAAAWRRPELYLNPEVRAGISSFALAESSLVQVGIESLEADLSSGQWDRKYGEIRMRKEVDVGYRFLRATL